jgi:hypothetical protein
MQGLVDWVTKSWQQVKAARVEFDARPKRPPAAI